MKAWMDYYQKTCKWQSDARKSWISPNPTLASSISCSADKRTSCSKPSMATLLSNPPWHKRDCLQDNMKTPTHHVIKIDNWAMGHHKTQKKQHDKLNKFRLSSNLAQSRQRYILKTSNFPPYSFKTLLSLKIFHQKLGLVNLVWQRSDTFLIARPSTTV